MEICCEPNTFFVQTKLLATSSSNLADMLTIVNPIDFGGHSSKVKVMMGIIDKYGVRGDATLCVVIFFVSPSDFLLQKKLQKNKHTLAFAIYEYYKFY